MSRTLTATNQAGVDLTITQPGYLVELCFSEPLRVTSIPVNSTVDVDVDFTSAVVDVSINMPKCAVGIQHDKDFTYLAKFRGEGLGQVAKVYEVYGFGGTYTSAQLDLVYDGIIDDVRITMQGISIGLIPHEPFMSPIYRVDERFFKSLPQDGTRIETKAGTYVLRRDGR